MEIMNNKSFSQSAAGNSIKRYKSPLYVLWDLTYKCNHSCFFCYNNCPKNTVSSLTNEELDSIAKQMIDNEVISVSYAGGEPLLEKHTVLRLGRAMKEHIWLTLITNGTLITPELARPLSDIFSGIQISLHDVDSGHDHFVGVPGAYERVINGIEALGNVGYDQIEICFVLTKVNQHAFESVIERVSQLGNVARIRVQNFIPSGKGYTNQRLLYMTSEQVMDTVSRYRAFIEGKKNIAFLYDDVADELIYFRETSAPNPFLHIYPDGSVGVFPHIPVVFGNLVNETLQSIWKRRGSDFFKFPEIRSVLDRVTANDDLGLYDQINFRPWIDKHITF